MDKKDVKVKLEELSKLVNEFDPLGLIALGAPKDEYDCLRDKLFSMLINKKSNNNISAMLTEELAEHFGVSEKEIVTLRPKMEQFINKVMALNIK